jgi:hypothetical protein
MENNDKIRPSQLQADSTFREHMSATMLFQSKGEGSGDSDGSDDSTTTNFSFEEGFNPFKPRKVKSGLIGGSTGLGIGTSTQVSSRQMTMKDVVNELLCVIDNDESMEQVLQTSRTFLMEPFDNVDGFLEPDSIYDASMSRQERLEKFRVVMEDRIAQARNGGVKTTLKAIQEFVLRNAEEDS